MPSLLVTMIALLLAPMEALVIGSAPHLRTMVTRSSPIRLQDEPPPPPPKGGRLGGTVDQDGKSNVWVRARALGNFGCAYFSGEFRRHAGLRHIS